MCAQQQRPGGDLPGGFLKLVGAVSALTCCLLSGRCVSSVMVEWFLRLRRAGRSIVSGR